MVRTERRPFGVTFAVGWGLILAGMLMARAAGNQVVPAVFPEGLASGMALTAVQGTLAFFLVVSALFVFRLSSWARRLAMVVFLVAGGISGATLLDVSLFGFVVVALNVTAAFMLAMHADAFRSERPDIDDSGSATHFGAP